MILTPLHGDGTATHSPINVSLLRGNSKKFIRLPNHSNEKAISIARWRSYSLVFSSDWLLHGERIGNFSDPLAGFKFTGLNHRVGHGRGKAIDSFDRRATTPYRGNRSNLKNLPDQLKSSSSIPPSWLNQLKLKFVLYLHIALISNYHLRNSSLTTDCYNSNDLFI
jgi:hypothetical protein